MSMSLRKRLDLIVAACEDALKALEKGDSKEGKGTLGISKG